jgi:hypothetical protein
VLLVEGFKFNFAGLGADDFLRFFWKTNPIISREHWVLEKST